MKAEVSVDRLRELLTLDSVNGHLLWRQSRAGVRAGSRAGYMQKSGYRYLEVDGVGLRENRVIFAITHGRWPDAQVDHRNRIKDCNRPDNLREATCSQNQMNTPPRKSRLGVKGVYSVGNRFIARIMADHKDKYLGTFDSIEEASAAYQAAAKQLHGSFFPEALV